VNRKPHQPFHRGLVSAVYHTPADHIPGQPSGQSLPTQLPPEIHCQAPLLCPYFFPGESYLVEQRFQLILDYLSAAIAGKIINEDNFFFDNGSEFTLYSLYNFLIVLFFVVKRDDN
jgi:hypothetical protein